MMARDLLTIPISTIASKYSFSLGGKTISLIRSALKAKTVQALICLQDWRHAEYDVGVDIDNDFESEEHEVNGDEEDDPNLFFKRTTHKRSLICESEECLLFLDKQMKEVYNLCFTYVDL